MRITELNHVALHVADVERSKRFYEQVLELAWLYGQALMVRGLPDFQTGGTWWAGYTAGERNVE